tara:strand:- start:10876 stop:12690 length:1815 start_codon:yes stop_codon:yes gene_type:complete
MDSIINILYLILVVGCIFSAGKWIAIKLNLIKNKSLFIENITISIGLGFSLLIIIIMLLGFAGLLYSKILWVILLLFIFLGIVKNYFIIDKDIFFRKVSGLKKDELLILFIISICSLMYLLTALTPTLDGDSLSSYLLMPREYAKNNSILVIDYAIGNMYPQNGQLISTLGILLKDQILAQLLISWLMGIICILTIFSIGKLLFNKNSALIGVLIWYSTFAVAFLNQSAKIDLAWSAFDLLGVYCFINWYYFSSTQKNNWLFISGLFFGIASGIKQASFFTLIIILVAIAYRSIPKKELIKSFTIFLLPVSICLVWILRSYFMTGSFIYSGGDLFSDNGFIGFIKVLWQMSMLGNASSLEGPMGKSIGPTIIAVLPLIFLIKNKNKKIWHVLIFCGLMLILWYNGVQRARHLLPTLGLLSLLCGYVINYLLNVKKKSAYFILLLSFVSISLNLTPWIYVNFFSINRFNYIIGKDDLTSYLEKNLSKWHWYPNFQITNKINNDLPVNTRIAALSTANSYYIDRPFYAPGPALIKSAWTDGEKKYPDHLDYYNMLINENITHIFINNYAVQQRSLQNSWINQAVFKEKYLDLIFDYGEQYLFKIKK